MIGQQNRYSDFFCNLQSFFLRSTIHVKWHRDFLALSNFSVSLTKRLRISLYKSSPILIFGIERYFFGALDLYFEHNPIILKLIANIRTRTYVAQIFYWAFPKVSFEAKRRTSDLSCSFVRFGNSFLLPESYKSG